MSNGRHFPIQSFVWSVVLVAAAAGSVYLAYELVIVPRRALQDQIRDQKETIGKLEQDKQRLEAYLKILEHTDRRARVEVLRQTKDPQGNLQTTIRFTETDADGKPISVSRELTLPGQEIYFDTMVIKFEDHFVEQGDPLKGHALMLFRRIFSNTMRAEDGFVIDKEGQPPEIYAEPSSQRLREGALETFLGACQRRKTGQGARRAGDSRRRALHAYGARSGIRDLPEVDRRSHHYAGNPAGAFTDDSVVCRAAFPGAGLGAGARTQVADLRRSAEQHIAAEGKLGGITAAKAGTKENPWNLKTPPGTSGFEAYKDESSDPPALVVQGGSTQLRYRLALNICTPC